MSRLVVRTINNSIVSKNILLLVIVSEESNKIFGSVEKIP